MPIFRYSKLSILDFNKLKFKYIPKFKEIKAYKAQILIVYD